MACFEHKEKFLDFKMKSDHIDLFLMDLLYEKSHADLLVLSRLSVSYGQSFSTNKEVNDCNMLEEH